MKKAKHTSCAGLEKGFGLHQSKTTGTSRHDDDLVLQAKLGEQVRARDGVGVHASSRAGEWSAGGSRSQDAGSGSLGGSSESGSKDSRHGHCDLCVVVCV